ncbi:MAG: helix-turn-helix domain-containing protein [Solirubrobacteraceae bacterium]|nr:helix-turn-helix domain-containing protein [Solirubrobacteraceae bacterium]
MSTGTLARITRDDTVRTFGARMHFARHAREMTQPTLAKAAGLTAGQISTLERGRHEPKAYTLHSLAQGLSTTVAWLAEPREVSDDEQVPWRVGDPRPVDREALNRALAERLCEARARAGLSVFELSLASGLWTARINEYEGARNGSPHLRAVHRLAAALGVTSGWLLAGWEREPWG